MTRIIILLLALVACSAPASTRQPAVVSSDPADLTAASCGARGCSTSSECGDVHSACNYCFGGTCRATLPADPTPDAGVDAPGGTQSGK